MIKYVTTIKHTPNKMFEIHVRKLRYKKKIKIFKIINNNYKKYLKYK